jgi:hypothetical protein
VERAAQFYTTHNAGNTAFPFPKDLFLKFIRENNGYFPVRLQALPEGTCAHIHTPGARLSRYRFFLFEVFHSAQCGGAISCR